MKHRFDPESMLNPGKIVDPPRMDDRRLFRYAPDYRVDEFKTVLDWSAYPGAGGGFQGAVEMCNNNGACRKLEGGVMCPSYRATRDEKHVTRGRANTLRLAISGQLGADALASDAMMETLKLCVSCKACRHECPTGVDMAKMKIEVLAARAAKHGLSLRDRMIGYLPRYAALGLAIRTGCERAKRSPMLRGCSNALRASAPSANCRNGGAMCSQPCAEAFGPTTAAKSYCSPTPSTAPSRARTSMPRCACWSLAAIACICRNRPRQSRHYAAAAPFWLRALLTKPASNSTAWLRPWRRSLRAAFRSSVSSRVAC